jgi:oligopeptide/dipeptide ABC transporter ATP-binding protein
MESRPVLTVNNLTTYFNVPQGIVNAVNGVSFTLYEGKTLGLVGESGCGKSVTALSLLNMIGPPGEIASGEAWLNGKNLLALSKRELRRVRGKEISLVFQDPTISLNPVLTVATQLVETILSHEKASLEEARSRIYDLLSKLNLPAPRLLIRRYPYQLSGGMCQRVMIAMAMSLAPRVLIADEPTTSLDVTIQAQILSELRRLQREFNTAVLLISHDLGVVAELADDVAVMYAGSIVEYGSLRNVLSSPLHPYTRALLRSVPRLAIRDRMLEPVQGQQPTLLNLADACAFAPRCPLATPECLASRPELALAGSDHLVACIHVDTGAKEG